MAKKMMILGASALQIPAIRKAKELGYQVILVDYDKDAVAFPMADVKLVISTLDKEEVLKQARVYRPDVILTSTSDAPVRTAAYVNERMGKKPDLSYLDSICATVKSSMRDRLKQYGLPIPQYYVVQNEAEFKEAIKALRNRAVIKPTDNAGSRGVVLLDGEDEEEALLLYEYSKKNSRGGIVMVEEVMTGPEISVEAMTVERETTVIAITDKIITDPPYFVELGHAQPSKLTQDIKDQVIDITIKAAGAIGMVNCPSHTEIKITPEGPKIVEIAARLGGDYITSKLVPLSTGVDIAGESIVLATGGVPDLSLKWEKGAAVCFLHGKEGIIQSIEVPEDLYNDPFIEEIVLDKKEGDLIHDAKSSSDRIGHVIASAPTRQEALEAAQKAIKRIRILIQ